MMTLDYTAIALALIGMLSGWATWWLDRRKHRQEVEGLKSDNRQKDLKRRTSERRDQAGLGYPEREGGNAKRNLSKDYVTEWRTYIAEPLTFVDLWRDSAMSESKLSPLRSLLHRLSARGERAPERSGTAAPCDTGYRGLPSSRRLPCCGQAARARGRLLAGARSYGLRNYGARSQGTR